MPLILLDRDGVLNHDRPESVRALEFFEILPNALEGVCLLSQTRWPIALVTNQAVVGRGELSRQHLDEIHAFLIQQVKNAGGRIDHIYVCTDTQIEPNKRRKPAPGMLLEAMALYNTPPQETVMIGDAPTDMQAATNAGCHKILVRTGKGEETLRKWQQEWGTPCVCDDLLGAARMLTTTSFFDNRSPLLP